METPRTFLRCSAVFSRVVLLVSLQLSEGLRDHASLIVRKERTMTCGQYTPGLVCSNEAPLGESNLGEGISSKQCRKQCEDSVDCAYACYNAAAQTCTSFAACDTVPDAKYMTYEACMDSQREPSDRSKEMTCGEYNPGLTCSDEPPSGKGNLGEGISSKQCRKSCEDSADCTYASYNSASQTCTSFATCDAKDDSGSMVYQACVDGGSTTPGGEMEMKCDQFSDGIVCSNKPPHGEGDLGEGMSSKQCRKKCEDTIQCTYASFSSAGQCTSFSTCDAERDPTYLTYRSCAGGATPTPPATSRPTTSLRMPTTKKTTTTTTTTTKRSTTTTTTTTTSASTTSTTTTPCPITTSTSKPDTRGTGHEDVKTDKDDKKTRGDVHRQ
mmetsp:Transcript_67629/g.147305  ORF Transcript_67629/g.147305 Transcript_67629/m.147305 type:complete len:383 (-) Transcript_67629:189-1337(-)